MILIILYFKLLNSNNKINKSLNLNRQFTHRHLKLCQSFSLMLKLTSKINNILL